MKPEDFAPNAPGRVLRVGEGKAVYWAFIPDPLPPALSLDWPLMQTLSRADRALGELAGLGRALTNPHLLIGPFIRREAVLSSRIEGTQTDLPHLYAYEAGQLALPGLEPHPPEADLREVLNYVHALEYGLKRIEKLPLSLRLLRELHARLLQGVRGEQAKPGEFRRTQNWIGAPGCTLNEATYVPPPPGELLSALAAFENYLYAEGRYPPLIRLALIHYQFEALHPFLDGNGRIGRLLITLLLVHWQILPLPLLYLSAWFEQHRDDYYRLLLQVSTSGHWQEWITFFLKGMETQARDAVQRAKALQDLQRRWRKQVSRTRASANLLRLVDFLFESPVLTIPQAAEKLGVTYTAAKNMIKRLQAEGIVQSYGEKTYGKTFSAPDILHILYKTPN